jgi:hypothetical protein
MLAEHGIPRLLARVVFAKGLLSLRGSLLAAWSCSAKKTGQVLPCPVNYFLLLVGS